ncbi:MAG: GNAT family N-acetyltransferase [Candidatus Bathyarchaeota archaeon]|nr:GNAT family N-acetyltransferase [Candidatus Bathyarchaeota archaeon]
MITFRVMKPTDLPFFMHLMDMVGWGMTPQDYDRILRFSPTGCFIASENNQDLGMVATTNYGTIAWIGNLVVQPETRGKGIGAALMQHAIDHLVSKGTKAIRLDGVQAAVPLYRRLGFKDEYWSLRHTGTATHHTTDCTPMKPEDLDAVSKLDKQVFKDDRRHVIEYFYELYPELCYTAWENDKLVGYIMAKEGASNTKIGPWVAEPGHPCAEKLLYSVMNQRVGGEIWVGTPEGNKLSVAILEKLGFVPHPSSLRMCYGDSSIRENVEYTYGLGGPDKG